MRKIPYLVGIATLITGLLAVGLAVTRDHWWTEVSGAKIVYNGKNSPRSKLYVSKDNDYYIIDLTQADDLSELYVVNSRTNEVGLDFKSRLIKLPGYIYSRDYPVKTVLAGTEKAYPYAKVAVTDQNIELSIDSQHKINVSF
ncbi:MAG TPA: hypothetical protein VF571_06970 [Pyrinomonadaceae bacterium]|jgi:hypothetical protein